MINRQKLMTLIALLSLMLVLAACGRRDPDPTPTPEPAPVQEAESAVEAVEEEVAADAEAVEEKAVDAEEAVAEEVDDAEAAVEDAATGAEEAVAEEVANSEAAVEEVIASDAMTVTEAMTSTESMTATEEIMAGDAVTVTEEAVAAGDMTTTESITGTEAMAEVAQMTGPSGPLTLVSARQVTEIVDENDIVFAAVSPDGNHIVWAQPGSKRRAPGQFCVFTFSNAGKVCTDVPEEFEGYPYQLYWSPDSTQVAFTESPITLGLESDIWVFNIADGSFVNRTDDGVTGSYMSAESGSYALDLIPMWNPVDGQIYFWRVIPQGNSEFQVGIFSVDSNEGEAVEVRDVTGSTSAQLPIYNINFLSMDSVSAVSPDGTKIAGIMTEVSNFASSGSSLWVIDIADTSVEPQMLMSTEDFQAAYPVWQNLPGVPMGLSWTGDSAAVVVNVFSNDTHSPLQVYYNVDVASGEATPVVDFSGVASLETLFEPTEAGIPFRFYSPWTASLSPANDSVVMFNDLGGTAGVMQAMLPPDGELPPVLAAADSPLSMGGTRSSRSVDGKVLIYGVLLTFE